MKWSKGSEISGDPWIAASRNLEFWGCTVGKKRKMKRVMFQFILSQTWVPGGSVAKNACNAGDPGSIPRFQGEGNGYPLQYSCLENLMDRRAWWAIGHGVTKSKMHDWATNMFFQLISPLLTCLLMFFFFSPILICYNIILRQYLINDKWQ